jgi:uncharacterized membrane protein
LSFLEIISILGVIFHIVLILIAWDYLPRIIPVHYDFSGNVTSEGDKFNLLSLVLLSIVSYIVLTLLSRYPEKLNYPFEITKENADYQYKLAGYLISLIKLETIWIFALISLETIGIATGYFSGLGALFLPITLLVISATLISYFILSSKKIEI